jgi:hypothetical protein
VFYVSDKVPNQIFDKKSKCIKRQTIGRASDIHGLITELQILLEPERLFGDIRALAEKFGYNNNRIQHLLSQRGSPTEHLLNANSHHTIEFLRNKLVAIERDDAVQKVDKYLECQGCNCEECGGIC